MRYAVVGAVGSTATTLKTLVAAGANIVGVSGLSTTRSGDNSDYVDLAALAHSLGVISHSFDSVNEVGNVDFLVSLDADYILFVGLSQIVGAAARCAAHRMAVGLHPTPLPRYRGRSALSWLILLGVPQSAVTLFVLEDIADAGAIIVQQPYAIGTDDYLQDVMRNVNDATEQAVLKFMQAAETSTLYPVPQDESKASVLLRRGAPDGLLDFAREPSDILRLVRAVSRPYPGAYCYYEGHRVTIWHAETRLLDCTVYGKPGQIISCQHGELHILLNNTTELVTGDYDVVEGCHLRAGHWLGTREQDELQLLRRRMDTLEERVRRLEE